MRIGIAGLGKMGAAMATRLQEMGEDVIVWNRTRTKAEATELPVANTPRELTDQTDVVISTLFDASAVHTVYHPSFVTPRKIDGFASFQPTENQGFNPV